MCIFCGGTCGGAGDIILPSVAAGASLVVLKIQVIRESSKKKNLKEMHDEEAVE